MVYLNIVEILKLNMDVYLARGYIMALMVFLQNIHVFNCRSERTSAFFMSLKKNPFIVLTSIGSIILQIFVMESSTLSNYLKAKPIPYSHMFILICISLVILIAVELYKLVKNKKM